MKRAAPMGSALGIILALVLSSEVARACVYAFPNYKVRATFIVTVEGLHGVPLDGIRVVAIPDLSLTPAAEVLTDKDGRAVFQGLKGGHYLMTVQRGEITGGAAELDVVTSDGLTKFSLVWPSDPVFKVQRIAGTLLRAAIPGAPNMDKEAPLSGVDLSLKEVISGREIGRTSTDDQGGFASPEVVPGLYALHMKWHGIAGYFLLEVNAKTQDAKPSRFLINPTDCGLGAHKE